MATRDLTFDEMRKPGMTLIDRKQLLGMVPLSERTILDMENRGEFPRRFTITSRRVAWDLSEVTAWIESRRSAGGKASMPGRRKPSVE